MPGPVNDIVDNAALAEERARAAGMARQQERAARREVPFVRDGVRVCRDCLEPLDAKRLEAAPDSVRCIECQRDQDRRAARG